MSLIEKLDQKPKEFIDLIKEYSKNPVGFLLIAGSNGNGKSYAAKCIYELNARFILPCRDDDEAIFIRHDDLKDRLSESHKNWGNLTFDKQVFNNTKLLILDDLGVREPTEQMIGFLHSVLDHRYDNRHQLGTVITTNLNSKTFGEKFTSAILSRAASGKKFRLDTPDRRASDEF